MGLLGPHYVTSAYLPPDISERTQPQPQPVSWYSIYLPRRDGRLSWPKLPGNAPAGSRTRDTSPTLSPLHYRGTYGLVVMLFCGEIPFRWQFCVASGMTWLINCGICQLHCSAVVWRRPQDDGSPGLTDRCTSTPTRDLYDIIFQFFDF